MRTRAVVSRGPYYLIEIIAATKSITNRISRAVQFAIFFAIQRILKNRLQSSLSLKSMYQSIQTSNYSITNDTQYIMSRN